MRRSRTTSTAIRRITQRARCVEMVEVAPETKGGAK